MAKGEKTLNKNFVSQIVKGCFVGLIASLVGILLFAFVLRFVNISDLTIKIVNQIIKGVSVLLGVFICLKNNKEKGLVKGAIIGAVYTLLSYLIFSVLVANFSFSASIIYDMIFASVIGLICGVMFVNLKR